MSHWELSQGLTDDYYTPPEVFSALQCGKFDGEEVTWLLYPHAKDLAE